jgi:hypothetical protein
VKRFKLESAGRETIITVDDCDAYLLRTQRWHWQDSHVWRGNDYSPGGRVILSHLLMDAPKGTAVGHLNGDVRDFRRSNLIICKTITEATGYTKRGPQYDPKNSKSLHQQTTQRH